MSPANPTGVTMDREELAAVSDICRAHGLPLISDEIYHGLEDGDGFGETLADARDAIVVNSFSKFFAMTGWRIGWIIAPAARMPLIERLSMNLYLSPPTLSQIAAEAALFRYGGL